MIGVQMLLILAFGMVFFFLNSEMEIDMRNLQYVLKSNSNSNFRGSLLNK